MGERTPNVGNRSVWVAATSSCLVAVALGCTVPYTPEVVAPEKVEWRAKSGTSVAIAAREPLRRKASTARVDPYVIAIDHAEATEVAIESLASVLESAGVSVERGQTGGVELEVLHLAWRTGNPMDCIVDVTLHSASGEARGVQTRATSWSFLSACHEALARVGPSIVAEPKTRRLLLGPAPEPELGSPAAALMPAPPD